MFDVVIEGGTVVDGRGGAPFVGDLAIEDGRIVEVGGRITGPARERVDAQGALVTPGWVDVHTHYDGQVLWDDAMLPSADNGTTTVITGNCGVGFAPVRPGTERELIELMEGVEDIPGTALHEGMPWGEWETFPQYLDLLAGREYALDVGTQIAHGPVRYYAMGDRGRSNEDAAADDIEAMARIVEQAVRAGALGFSTSRTIGHRSLWGTPVPGTFAVVEELRGIAAGMARAGRGVFQAIPASTVGPLEAYGGERSTQEQEHALLTEISRATGLPVTFTLIKSPGYRDDLWRDILRMTAEANASGAQLFPQVSSRAVGFLTGLSAYHPFMRKPTYLERLAVLPVAERARAMREPDMKARLLAEPDVSPERPGTMDNAYAMFQRHAAQLYPLSDPVDYDAPASETIGARAASEGREPLEVLYDVLTEGDGSRFASFPTSDFQGYMSVAREMLLDANTVTGLSDAGAHVTFICDGTMATTQLAHWTRDRRPDEQLPIEFLVHKQTARNAALYGLTDRGALTVGLRADVNVIDHAGLRVSPPVARRDLPAGGVRLVQPVQGYVATFCNGVRTRDHDRDTGARPGRLVR